MSPKSTVLTLLALALMPLPARTASQEEVQRAMAVMESMHYDSGKKVDDSLSEKILGIFIDSLDPTRTCFLEGDILNIRHKFSKRLDDDLKTGDLASAREIYRIFVERLVRRNTLISQASSSVSKKSPAPSPSSDGGQKQWCKNESELKASLKSNIRRIIGLRMAEEREGFEKSKSHVIEEFKKSSAKHRLATSEELDRVFLVSACEAFDPHSSYLAPSDVEDMGISMGLQVCGIGVEVDFSGDSAKISNLVPSGPAAKSGQISVGDNIVGVGDTPTGIKKVAAENKDQLVSMIRGPEGTNVFLEIAAPGEGGRLKMVGLTRENVQLDDKALKGGVIKAPDSVGPCEESAIGIMVVPSFYADGESRSTAKDASQVLSFFKKNQVSAVVIDLRQNGGGSLGEALKLAGIFLPGLPVAQTKDSRGAIEIFRAEPSPRRWDCPTVVLVDSSTASASEIFASALQDHGAAVIAGDSRTYGKGTIQSVVDLNPNPVVRVFFPSPETKYGAVKVTTQKLYRPNGGSTQAEGVQSDIHIPSPTDKERPGEQDLPEHLGRDTVAPLSIVRGGKTKDLIPVLKKISEERVSRSAVLGKERKPLIEGSDKSGPPDWGQAADPDRDSDSQESSGGVLDIQAPIISCKKGGDVKISSEKISALYTETNIRKNTGVTRDAVLEEALAIAGDFSRLAKCFNGPGASPVEECSTEPPPTMRSGPPRPESSDNH